jgi:Uncharacterized conserved protein
MEFNDITIVGLKGIPYGSVIESLSKNKDFAVMNASFVLGCSHVESAAMHASRSFENGTNRSKTFVTEFLLYMAGERQISKALTKMTPKDGEDMVAVVFNNTTDLSKLEKYRDDMLIEATEEKAKLIGWNGKERISYEDLALEMVAFVDILKV